MKVVIIIPTFNERENIQALVPELDKQFGQMAHKCQILVVDDNSPDGTAEAVRELQHKFDNIHLITGEKNGLGAAYMRGMKYAVDTLQADVVFEMDADFSHKPEDVPRLMAEIDAGADFVIGSRYVLGGTIPKEWGWHRKLNSWGGNAVARNVAGIYGVRDCTAGFRAIRTMLLRKINLSNLRVQGYAFQVALLHAAKTEGAIIEEIPVEFVERSQGESKLGLRDILEFIINAWWIRLHSSKTFIKFAIVGLSGVVVNLCFFTLFLMMGMNKYLASPLAIELSIVSNFLLNNYWTFRWRKTMDRTGVRGLKFNGVAAVAHFKLRNLHPAFLSISACGAPDSSVHRYHSGNVGELLPQQLLDISSG
jgi:dolichol-phosphate mannosyltransferase